MSFSKGIEAVTEPVNKLLVPLASSAGQTLQDVWELVFGNFGNYVEKKRVVRLKALQDFKQSLEDNIAAIPDDRICEPSLSIVGPALDASKYYFEEPSIREMFAKLVAASVDKQKESMMHPSYPEIIKQMSPLDAENLSYITHQVPIAEYCINHKLGGYKTTALSNVFLENRAQLSDLPQQARSLASLSRLGLILIEYGGTILERNYYTEFYSTPYFKALVSSLTSEEQVAGVIPGRAKPTPFGQAFISVCLS